MTEPETDPVPAIDEPGRRLRPIPRRHLDSIVDQYLDDISDGRRADLDGQASAD